MDDGGRSTFFNLYPVPRETQLKLDLFAALVERHGKAQNLVAASTMKQFWNRHMLDSAQVITLAPAQAGSWVDVGSGAGLPGVVLALLSTGQHTLVEPRRLRADFLRIVVAELDLGSRVTVAQSNVERVTGGSFEVITARAFASLLNTIKATAHLASRETSWVLHKGRNAAAEVAEARQVWDGDFVLTPSITDPEAAIVTLGKLRRGTNH